MACEVYHQLLYVLARTWLNLSVLFREEVENLLSSHNLEVPNIDCHLVPAFWYARWEWHTVDDNAPSPGLCDTSPLFKDVAADGDEDEVKGDEPSLVEVLSV